MAKTLNCNGKTLDLSTPVVMGILNLTPDSFFDGGRYGNPQMQLLQVEKMIADGATVIDIGAVSTRPGAAEVSEEEELRRLLPSLDQIIRKFPGVIISVDTYRPAVARAAVEHGAGMVNDIYAGRFDPGMIPAVAALKVPYILMHMKGTPADMQKSPEYDDVIAEVYYFLEHRLEFCRDQGLTQVILDPGFGFGKTVQHNFALLSGLEQFRSLDAPILAGLSRKSMICKTLQTTSAQALNGTTILNTIALIKGADILRVHDVKEAVEVVKLVNRL